MEYEELKRLMREQKVEMTAEETRPMSTVPVVTLSAISGAPPKVLSQKISRVTAPLLRCSSSSLMARSACPDGVPLAMATATVSV